MAAEHMNLLTTVLEQIEEEEIQNVRFEFLDSNSVARSKTIPARHFKSTVSNGITFPMLVYSWDANADISAESVIFKKYGNSDMICHPDLSTFTVLPWVKDTARVYVTGSSVGDGDKVLVDPRNIALAQLENLKRRDISIFSTFEHEFWVVDEKTRKPIIDGLNCFSTLRLAKHQAFFDKTARNLYEAGVDVECIETEYAMGQFEMPIDPTFGIRAADNGATFRTGVKEMAMQEGMVASFMAKPYRDEEGSSAHLNHSLWSLDGKTSKLSDQSRQYGLSETGEHWIAGLLDHAPALSLLQSPTLSCRDRFKPGTFAPFNATWGIDNRTCAIRLKRTGTHGIYLENRLGSSAGNPYISLAATIAAGLNGVDRKLPLPPPVPFNKSSDDEDHVPPDTVLLPGDMESALQSLKTDEVMTSAIGEDFVDALESIRHLEMEKFANTQVGKFELYRKLYFDYI